MTQTNEIGTVKPLNEAADAVITALQTTQGEALIGPVGRAGCMVVGETACKTTCQLWALEQGTADEQTVELVEAGLLDPGTVLDEDPQACPDENLGKAFKVLGVESGRALMVAVGVNKAANRVGYVDEPGVRASIIPHPRGWYEITPSTPYNAIYARDSDVLPNGEPVELIGMRVAGNGLVIDDIQVAPGQRAYGMTHLTRTNMPGSGHEDVYDGKQQTYRRYVAEDSMRHYGVSPQDVTTHILSAVGAETAQVRFSDPNLLESVMPGWVADGLINNISNPRWRPGMPLVDPRTGEYHVLQRNYPEQIRRQVYGAAAELGVTDVREDGVLDPGDTSGNVVHSSADRARNAEDNGSDTYIGRLADRDLYAVVIKRPAVS